MRWTSVSHLCASVCVSARGNEQHWEAETEWLPECVCVRESGRERERENTWEEKGETESLEKRESCSLKIQSHPPFHTHSLSHTDTHARHTYTQTHMHVTLTHTPHAYTWSLCSRQHVHCPPLHACLPSVLSADFSSSTQDPSVKTTVSHFTKVSQTSDPSIKTTAPGLLSECARMPGWVILVCYTRGARDAVHALEKKDQG